MHLCCFTSFTHAFLGPKWYKQQLNSQIEFARLAIIENQVAHVYL